MSRAGTERGGIRQKPEVDHAYNITNLHKIFFVTSLLSLLSVVFWVGKIDYDKPWKRYQREFTKIQLEETRKAIQNEDKRLGGGSTKQKLDALEAGLAKSNEEMRAHRADLDQAERRVQKAKEGVFKTDSRQRGFKAVYDTFRYKFEVQRQEAEEKHQSLEHLQGQKTKLDELEKSKLESALAFEKASADLDSASAQVTRIRGSVDRTQKDLDALYGNKKRLEVRAATLKTDFVNVVRNSPMMDFMAPSLKIQQVVIDDLRFEVNYQTISRVDRCTTCHLGIDKKGYENAPQPYRTHPNFDLFLSSKSPHKLEDIGCSECHSGWDRSVDFMWSAHSPKNEEQAKEWKKRYHWHEIEKWDWPMLPAAFTESQCYKCHKDEVHLAGAPQLNKGREIFERVGCWTCHKLNGQTGPKVAPSLRHVAGKTTQDWVRRWVEDPTSFRPTTLMPKIFDLSNTSDEYYRRRNGLEIAALADYLFEKSEPLALLPLPARSGDAVHGKDLVERLGCKGCHLVGTPEEKLDTSTLRQRFGPNLAGLPAKTTQQWVYNWIKNPKAINPDSRMPNLRLSDEEATDLVAYLWTLQPPEGFTSRPLPALDPKLRDDVTLEYLKNTLSQPQAEKRVAEMGDHDKMVFLGQKLVGRYGCYGCHDIPGFEKVEPIGAELTEEGSKIVAKFDFAHVHEVPHTRWDWIQTKVRDTRIWDREVIKPPQDKLRMPQFNLSQDQVEAVTTFVLGLMREQVPASKRKVYDPHEIAGNRGQRLVANKNCMGCHNINGFGGDFAQFVDDPSKAPPVLTPEGAKVQPEFLYNFLKGPTTIRPWLNVRMPTFGFTDDEVAKLIDMFQGIARVDERYPHYDMAQATPQSLAHGRDLFGERGTASWDKSLKCNSCHPSGNIMPTSEPTQWGPNLAMAHRRLRPEWVPQWLHNPAGIQPGTRMPNFFYDGDTKLTEDPDRDIQDVRNYLWTLRESGEAPGRVSMPAPAPRSGVGSAASSGANAPR